MSIFDHFYIGLKDINLLKADIFAIQGSQNVNKVT